MHKLISTLKKGVLHQSQSVVALLQNDSRQAERWEDDLIAWTWREYADRYEEDPDTADPEIILRMPMVKVRLINSWIDR